MALYKVQTSLRLDPEVLDKITAIARLEERSTNAQYEYIIKEYIKKYEAENGPVEVE